MLTTTTLVDVALAAIALEAVGLWAWWLARGRRGLHPFDVLAHLAAGALLLGAVRLAVGGADPLWVLALVGASLPAHLLDLWRRSRSAASGRTPSDAPR